MPHKMPYCDADATRKRLSFECMSPEVAHSERASRWLRCPLLGVERTCIGDEAMSAPDPVAVIRFSSIWLRVGTRGRWRPRGNRRRTRRPLPSVLVARFARRSSFCRLFTGAEKQRQPRPKCRSRRFLRDKIDLCGARLCERTLRPRVQKVKSACTRLERITTICRTV
jgi:hypothetical protein